MSDLPKDLFSRTYKCQPVRIRLCLPSENSELDFFTGL